MKCCSLIPKRENRKCEARNGKNVMKYITFLRSKMERHGFDKRRIYKSMIYSGGQTCERGAGILFDEKKNPGKEHHRISVCIRKNNCSKIRRKAFAT